MPGLLQNRSGPYLAAKCNNPRRGIGNVMTCTGDVNSLPIEEKVPSTSVSLNSRRAGRLFDLVPKVRITEFGR